MGYQATLAVARQCPQSLIVIASRTDPHDAATTINRMLKQDNVKYMALDLGFLANVRKFVKKWKEEVHLPIRALVLNAAIQFPRDIKYSTDGMEMSFAVNHVGHALLTHLLLGEMDRKARIVVVASSVSGYSSQSSHATLPPLIIRAPISTQSHAATNQKKCEPQSDPFGSQVHDPAQNWGLKPHYTTASEAAFPSRASLEAFSGQDRYATSKLANVLWTKALARHMGWCPSHASKTVVALDPGLMPGTGMLRNASPVFAWLVVHVAPYLVWLLRLVMHPNVQTPRDSGESLAWLATSEEVAMMGCSGAYFEQRGVREVGAAARVEATQEELWEWTVERIAETPEQRQTFEKLA
ncbi:NAD(P)-binding protein [Corynespora cassiicola Philippines]|uniref:NAD(P)-binding protein n=1 Tax=Corynespora cassiicola Philippines TaxID=1448308 RepID=A0A2T2NB17_CORCC|nr:NAD(P)-binding protein [Corynespora cassiicola Philippines]